MFASLYRARSGASVNSDPASNSHAPARRSIASAERASSFGFELAERRALASGEPELLGQFFDRSFERVHAYLARMVNDPHVAEDLAQETFLRVQRGLKTYRPELALRPWLFTVASNVLRDHFAARRSATVGLDDVDADASELTAAQEGPGVRVERGERALATRQALQSLSEQARAVLVLRHYEALSFPEIAAALRISEDTARQRHLRALQRLRVLLADFAPDSGGAA